MCPELGSGFGSNRAECDYRVQVIEGGKTVALIRRVMSGILFSWVSQVAVAQIAVAQTAQEWANVDIVGSLSGHSHPVRVLMASPDGRYLLGLTDYEMALWDVSQGQLIRFLPGHLIDFGDPALAPLQVPARRAAFTADGRFVVSVLDDPGFATIQASLLMWDMATGEHRSLGSYLGCRDVAIAGSRMVTACDDGVQVWDLTTGDQQYVLYSFEQGGRPVETLALSPDGQTLATADLNATGGSEGEDATRIRLWALGESSGDPMAELRGHSSSIAQLAFSGDGRYLVSGGFGQGVAQIIIWDGQTG
jgi:WD40 repeat protein